MEIGYAPATVVSGEAGPFTGMSSCLFSAKDNSLTFTHLGALIGVFATKNGGSGTALSYFSRWRYTGVAQQIDFDEYSPPIPVF